MPDVDEAGTDRVTRELTLANERLCARIFPIFLEQDRVISAPGGCTFDDGGVLLELSATGGAYAPVVIDWHPDRTMEPVDWQRLTVTELRRTLPSDHAAASRVRFGTQQLLVYRSLKNTSELRAVLGHHTGNETVIAGITHKGNVDPIALVEA